MNRRERYALRRRTSRRLGPHFAVVRISNENGRQRTETLSEHMTLKSASLALARWKRGC